MAKRSKPEIVDVEALRAALTAAELRADQATSRADQATSRADQAVRLADEAALRADEAQAAVERAKAEAAAVKAQLSGDAALIAHLRLEIAKLTRTLYGQRSERTQRLLDQYELQLEELEASAAADALAAEKAAAKAAVPAPTERRKPSRQPFPAQLPRVRVVVPAPTACPCCGDMRLSKMGEDVTETLEVVPRQWTVIQTVRERFSCRACESVTQPPAPFHAIPRGWAGPSLLAMVLFEKYGQHMPLNRQAERYAREGVPLSLSTLADQVGTCAGVLEPLFRLIERHVRAAGRLHGDDTTVPVLAKGKTSTGRVWVYVRDDRPFGGDDPPAALFHFSPDRRGEHPQGHLAGWTGVLQADAYGGYGKLYGGERKPAPIIEAACWAQTIRTQSRIGRPVGFRIARSVQRNDVLDLQCAVVNEDAFDHELEDGLPVAGRRGLQAASDPVHEAGKIGQGLARPKSLFAELVLHLTLLLDKPLLVGNCFALLGQLFEADHFGSIGLQETAVGAI